MIISEIQSEIGHCFCDGAKFKAPTDFSHHAILLYDIVLKFSKSKTQCVHFCQLCKQHDDPVLHLYGSPIPVVEESKFLGILFDRKLRFIPHIKGYIFQKL